jgi:hypothetical protein
MVPSSHKRFLPHAETGVAVIAVIGELDNRADSELHLERRIVVFRDFKCRRIRQYRDRRFVSFLALVAVTVRTGQYFFER